MNILVTGATGFVGSALVERLIKDGFSVRVAIRGSLNSKLRLFSSEITVFRIGSLGPHIDWNAHLSGVSTVVHLAGRAHVMCEPLADPLAEYRKINVASTLALARQSAACGVKRFIYLSSVKVNGESTSIGSPFSPDDTPMPHNAYAVSKYEAELGLLEIAHSTEMEVVIIRPPLVYGPGVKANFLSMMRWLSRSIPLPLGAINNLRSLVAIDNLVDLIVRCITHKRAANHIFLVSDGEDLSTTALLHLMGNALGKRVRLISIPISWLYFLSTLLGRHAMVERLCSSLQLDISKTRNLLDWSPPIGVDEGLRRAAQDFKKYEKII